VEGGMQVLSLFFTAAAARERGDGQLRWEGTCTLIPSLCQKSELFSECMQPSFVSSCPLSNRRCSPEHLSPKLGRGHLPREDALESTERDRHATIDDVGD
jgi:hypothetical protein